MKRFLKIAAAVIILGIIGYFLFWPKQKTTTYTTEKVKRGNVEQIVSVTGTVSAETKVDLKFQKPGKIDSIKVKEGDTVRIGDVLATLSANSLDIQVAQARAGLSSAQAALNLRLAGVTSQEIELAQKDLESSQVSYTISQTSLENTKASTEQNLKKAQLAVDNAKVSLENAQLLYKNAVSTGGVSQDTTDQNVKNAYINAKAPLNLAIINARAAMNQADQIVGINNQALNDAFEFYLGVRSQQTKNDAETAFKDAETSLKALEGKFATASTTWTNDEADSLLTSSQDTIQLVRTAMQKVVTLLEYTLASSYLSASSISTYQSSISTYATSLENNLTAIKAAQQAIINAKLGQNSGNISSSSAVDTAKTQLNTAQSNLATAQSNLEQARVENKKTVDTASADVDLKKVASEKAQVALDLKQAPPRAVDTAGLRAQVAQAQASYDLALQGVTDTKIISPINGTIATSSADEGENVSGAENIFTVITDSFLIKANVSETDIAKIKINQAVSMTLDAFPREQVFTGKVVSINPAETVVQGVIYYQVELGFDTPESGIKPGMTVNIEIVASKKDDVLSISPQALQYKDNKPYVRIPKPDGTTEDRNITLGLQGNTAAEVTDGLKEGEDVVIFEKK